MSYADAAAKGPKQTPEEVERKEEIETSSTVDVDSMHVHSVPSNYSGETDTQLNRYEQEARQAEEAAKKRLRNAEEEAHRDYKKGKSAATRKGKDARKAIADNKDNPVVVGNALVWAIVAGTLGFGAYQQHQAGKLDWKMGGIWAGAVGLFATGDYFVSQYLFKKYPPK